MARRRIKQKRKWYIPFMVIAVVFVLGFQLMGLYTKLSDYKSREAALTKELEDAMTTKEELTDYEAYTKTDEYIQNLARTKLGLVKENEIIFKEK